MSADSVRATDVLALVALAGFLGLSGCSAGKAQEGPSAAEIATYVTDYTGAITGKLVYKNGNPLYGHQVHLYRGAGGDVMSKVETLHDGKFYFKRLPAGTPTEYLVSARLKDWPECKVTVYANKFSNLTIQEPYREGTSMKGGCIRTP